MCDYSIEAYQSRPAEVGEKLTLERFPSGSMGFTSGSKCDLAVCVPADTKLRLEGLSETTQQTYGVRAIEDVVMTRLETGLYKDAVRFSNGTEVLLQRLDCGLSAMVVAATAELIDLSDLSGNTEIAARPAILEPV
jgi:hypothetical protein